MNRDELFDNQMERIGGRKALIAHVDATRQVGPPPVGISLIMDYRPEGGLVIGGFEDGHWWDTDTSTRFPCRPYAWAPLPFPEQ